MAIGLSFRYHNWLLIVQCLFSETSQQFLAISGKNMYVHDTMTTYKYSLAYRKLHVWLLLLDFILQAGEIPLDFLVQYYPITREWCRCIKSRRGGKSKPPELQFHRYNSNGTQSLINSESQWTKSFKPSHVTSLRPHVYYEKWAVSGGT